MLCNSCSNAVDMYVGRFLGVFLPSHHPRSFTQVCTRNFVFIRSILKGYKRLATELSSLITNTIVYLIHIILIRRAG